MDNPYADVSSTNPYATPDYESDAKADANIYAPAYQDAKADANNYVQPPYYPPDGGYIPQQQPGYYPQVTYPSYSQDTTSTQPGQQQSTSYPGQISYPQSPVYVSNPVVDSPQYAQPSIVVMETNAEDDPANEPPKENCCFRAFMIVLSVIIPCFGLFVLCCLSKTHPKTAKQCGIISFVLLWIFIFLINMYSG